MPSVTLKHDHCIKLIPFLLSREKLYINHDCVIRLYLICISNLIRPSVMM